MVKFSRKITHLGRWTVQHKTYNWHAKCTMTDWVGLCLLQMIPQPAIKLGDTCEHALVRGIDQLVDHWLVVDSSMICGGHSL